MATSTEFAAILRDGASRLLRMRSRVAIERRWYYPCPRHDANLARTSEENQRNDPGGLYHRRLSAGAAQAARGYGEELFDCRSGSGHPLGRAIAVRRADAGGNSARGAVFPF